MLNSLIHGKNGSFLPFFSFVGFSFHYLFKQLSHIIKKKEERTHLILEIIRIGNDKLKLILTDGDLSKYNLKLEGCRYDNTETRRVLWQILDEAKKETGFDAAAERTLVQAYPGRKGGCEIYVTRLASQTRKDKKESLYRFEDEETLFFAAKHLGPNIKIESSALYKDDGAYYLLLQSEKEEKGASLSSLDFLEEYGTSVKTKGACAYIKEHGECILERDAAKKLRKFMRFAYNSNPHEEK